MLCLQSKEISFDRPRQPKLTAFYQLADRFYPQFEALYEEHYQQRNGFWRPAIGTAVEKFFACGDLEQGFARVRCPECTLARRTEFSPTRNGKYCPLTN